MDLRGVVIDQKPCAAFEAGTQNFVGTLAVGLVPFKLSGTEGTKGEFARIQDKLFVTGPRFDQLQLPLKIKPLGAHESILH